MESSRTRIIILVAGFLFLGACFLTQYMHLEIKFSKSMFEKLGIADTVYLPPNEVLRFTVLAYEPFASDMVFMSAHNYFTTHLVFDRKYQWLDRYVDAIVGYCRGKHHERLLLPPQECKNNGAEWVDGLFPFNPRVYLWASQVVKYVQLLTNDVIDKSVYFGKTGIHFCPDSWELYFDVGFNLYFEYKNKTPQEFETLRAQGLEYIAIAAQLPGSEVDPNFVSGVLWNKEQTKRALQELYMSYYNATDIQRKEIRSRVKFYGEKELAKEWEKEEQEWKNDFPYFPQQMYHLIGPKYSFHPELFAIRGKNAKK